MTPIFVLSSGRTGTVFLTRTLPTHFPRLHAVHEPLGSRSTLMMANARNVIGVGRRAVRAKFRRELTARLDALPDGKQYVEVNPMLCSLTPCLAELPGPLNLIHLTREPGSWVRSMRAFRASGIRRHLIDWVPFANPYPAPRPEGWLSLSRVDRALWRWRYSNEQILALQPGAARYTRLRYEDLFTPGPEREPALRTLLAALDLPADADLEPLISAPRANPAPAAEPVHVPQESIDRICGPLLETLGYTGQTKAPEDLQATT